MGPSLLPITTNRLQLRRFRADDAPALAAYRSDPDVARFQSWRAPYPLAAAQRLIDGQATLSGPTPGDWMQIAVDVDGALIGDVAVELSTDSRCATIGYTMAGEHQGQGLAREAVSALVDLLFDHTGVHRVEASLEPRNVASARLLEHLGFEYEGTSVAAELVDEVWTDDERYALTDESRRAWRSRPHGPPGDVRLIEITPDNSRDVLRLGTHHSQERFVANMAKSFTDALFPPLVGGVAVVPWFRAIEADGVLAGFVMIAERTEAHPEAFLWRFLIDRRHQRRGIGARAVAELVDGLRAEHHDALMTTWVEGAGGPEPFYRRLGFVPTGEVDDGEIVARLRLADEEGHR